MIGVALRMAPFALCLARQARHDARNQPESSVRISKEKIAARYNRLLEPLAEGRLARQLFDLSPFTPQSGQRTRYTSITTLARNPLQGRARTARSRQSW